MYGIPIICTSSYYRKPGYSELCAIWDWSQSRADWRSLDWQRVQWRWIGLRSSQFWRPRPPCFCMAWWTLCWMFPNSPDCYGCCLRPCRSCVAFREVKLHDFVTRAAEKLGKPRAGGPLVVYLYRPRKTQPAMESRGIFCDRQARSREGLETSSQAW